MKNKHGGDIYRNQVTYDFSVNINPLGMPGGSLKAAQEGILCSCRYPDDRGEALCYAIAEAEGIKPDAVILGNGAAELIYALCYALKPKSGMVMAPSFLEYEAAITASGGAAVYWNLYEKEDFRLKEDILTAIDTDIELLFLCNPNNPTGNITDPSLLIAIAEKCEETETCFCVDECFLPFLETEGAHTMKHQLKRFPHMVVLRAFTKIYGMPGLRLGYAMTADEKLRDCIRHCIQPWNTSIPAQMAGIEALKDQAYIKRTRQLIMKEKNYLMEELSKGIAKKQYPSAANYIFFRSRRDLQERLLEEKILIRACGNYKNLSAEYFRIGVRIHKENMELISSMRRCLKTPSHVS